MRLSISGTSAARIITYKNLIEIDYQRMEKIEKSETIDHLASSFNSFAKSSAARLAVENVCDEKILRCVHYEGALFHVTTNSEERQITHSTLGDKFLFLKTDTLSFLFAVE